MLKIDLRQMRIFEALAEELHFGRTAHRLHTAQPVISKAIKDIEDEVGTTLVERTSRRVELTHAGKAFLASAKAALYHADVAVRAARSSTYEGIESLRLGLTIGAAQPPLGAIIRLFKERNPVAQIDVQELDEVTLGRAVSDGSVDAAIAWDRAIAAGLQRQHIFDVEMKIVLPEGHALSDKAEISVDDLNDVETILPSAAKQPVLRETYRAYCKAHGFEPQPVAEIANTADLLALVAGGVGVGHAPLPDGMTFPGVIIRSHVPDFKLGFDLVWSRTMPSVLELLRLLEKRPQ